jgi:HAD superfamily hydrolase (TIGR01459 family)
MPDIELIAGLSDFASRRAALICDVWGVVHNGVRAFPEACEALVRFRDGGGAVALVSNSPRPRPGFVQQLRDLGVPDAAWDEVVTSGDATRKLLTERGPGPVWAVGPARDAGLYEGLALDFSETVEDAAFISCSGLFDDETEVPEDYRARFVRAAERRLTMICANPDRVVRRGDQLIWCAGALADLYTGLGGDVLMAGKPFPPIYDLAREALSQVAGAPIDPARILVIGDGVPTDVKGANDQGLDCLFVVEGIHAGQLAAPQGGLDAERIADFLRREGVHARYAVDGLRW